MIRDRLVVGLRDLNLSEKLQMHADLTLKKAIDMARQSETVKKQEGFIRKVAGQTDTLGNVDAVKAKGGYARFNKEKKIASQQPKWNATTRGKHQEKCQRCVRDNHNRQSCPAKDATCHKCGLKGHFQRFCRTKGKVDEVEVSEEDELFLGEISSNANQAWKSIIKLNNKSLLFKLDSGADVCVISEKDFRSLGSNSHRPQLTETNKTLYGPCRSKLDCKETFKGVMRVNDVFARRESLRRERLGDTPPEQNRMFYFGTALKCQ